MVFQTKKKGELLCTKFTVWLPRDMLEKSKKLWFHEVLLYFGFCMEFLIKLLKKIEALLFFEIELVCGFDFFFFFGSVLRFVLFVG